MARPRLISDEQILLATREAVREHGARVSLDLVAEQLRVTAPALLKRFGSREELLIRALKPPERPAWLATFEAGPDERPLAEQLAAHFDRMWAYFEEMVPCVSALRESGIPHERFFDPRKDGPTRFLKVIMRWFEQAAKAGLVEVESPESAAAAILGALQIRAFTAHVAKVQYSSRSNREYLDDLVQLFVRSFTPRSRRGARTRQEVA